MAANLRFALRRLAAAPLFTIFSVISLAVGIGATTAVYSVVRTVTGPPPGVREADRLARIFHFPQGSLPIVAFSWPDFEALRARQTAFENIAGWRFIGASYMVGTQASSGWVEAVTGNYFETLGVRPAAGRVLRPDDDEPESPPVAVINYAVWRDAFGLSADAVGSRVLVNGVSFDVVGVAPLEFAGIFNGGITASAVWIPLNAARRLPANAGMAFDPDSHQRRWLMAVGRLAPGRSIQEGAADLARIGRQLDVEAPIGRELEPRFRTPWAVRRPWGAAVLGPRILGAPPSLVSGMTWTVLSIVTLVLLVACTNLTNLTLARLGKRRSEFALRAVLGGSRGRLFGELLTENIILTAAGGLAGVVVAQGLMQLFSTPIALGSGIVQIRPQLDVPVIMAAAAATALAVIVSGVVPAYRATRADLLSVLANDNAASTPRWRGRRYLITFQVAVSVSLVTLAVLSVQQIRKAGAIDTGVALDQLALARVDFAAQGYDEARTRQVVDRVIALMASRPGVSAVAGSSGLPFGLTTPGGTVHADRRRVDVEWIAATPGIFAALGVTTSRGRPFNGSDTVGAPPVAVLSEIAAKEIFGTPYAVGREVLVQRRRWAGEPEHPRRSVTIVGVASDTDARVAGERTHGTVYLPLDQQYEPRLVISARTDGDVSALVTSLRDSMRSVAPRLAISQLGEAPDLAGPSLTTFRVILSAAGTLGGFSLVLALCGLYGVISQLVTNRTREIGVRVALGASRRAVRVLVLREALSPVVLGVMAGLGLVVFVLRPILPGLMPPEARTLTLVAIAFLLVGTAACMLPAIRASRIEPSVALKDL